MIKKIKEIWNSHIEMLQIQKELKELKGLKTKPNLDNLDTK